MLKLTKKLTTTYEWLKLRKNTTPVHWGVGALGVFLSSVFYPAGWLWMASFAGLEHWNDVEQQARNLQYLPEGCTDWWEAYVVFGIGNSVLVILNWIGKFNFTWY